VNPWLMMLRDTAKQNLDVVPTMVESIKGYGILQSKVQEAAVGPIVAASIFSPNLYSCNRYGNSFL
jgi:hypothetical protein